MWNHRRKILSQNFLHSRKLVEELVRKSSIGPQDKVIEIGPGSGIITDELLHMAGHVTAIELDTRYYTFLQSTYKKFSYKLSLINKDFLQYSLPRHSYKVFANIPFSIEGNIIRKLLTAPTPPTDAYLVMREDLATRLGGFRRECQFSIFYKPWFTFELIHSFKKTDFTPYARMETAMLRFTKRQAPLLNESLKKQYMFFVGQGFGGGNKLRQNLRIYFTKDQFRKLADTYKFRVNCKPSALSLEQWVGMFLTLKRLGK